MDVKNIIWNDKQQAVIQSFKNKNTRLFLHGGVRSGKSYIAAWLIDFICSNNPGMTAFVFRQTFESIKTDTLNIFKRNPGYLSGKGVWKDGDREFNYTNGSKIYFRHTKGADYILGVTAGLIFFEQVELMAEDDFDLIKSTRLSQWGGQNAETVGYLERFKDDIANGSKLRPRNYLIMTANPRAGWVKSRYIDQDCGKEGIMAIPMSTYDNIQNLGEDFLNSMGQASDAFKRKYFDGSWEFNSGLIYPEFSTEEIIDGGNIVTDAWEEEVNFQASEVKTIMAIDPGYRKSKFAVLFAAVLRDGRIYIFDEVVKNGAKDLSGKVLEDYEKVGPDEMSKEIKIKYAQYHFTPGHRIIDNAAKDPHAGMGSVAGQFAKNGITLSSSKKGKEIDMIFKIKDLFKAKKIIVNSRCSWLIRELGLFRWEEKPRAGEQKPLDADNDLCLTADSLIEIKNGFKKIKDIKIGDIVKTSNGYEKVYDSRLTNPNAQIYELLMSNGKKISGTYNHPIYSNGKKITLSSMRYFDTIDVSHTKESTCPNTPLIKVSNIKDILKANISIFKEWMVELVNQNFCIEKFGLTPMGLLFQDMKYITSISTQPTMIYPTWNASPEKIIGKGIEEDFLINSGNTLNQSTNPQKLGILAQKEKSGIRIMLSKVLTILFPKILYALHVAKNINQKNMTQNTVGTTADQQLEEDLVSTMKPGNVSFVQKLLLLINILKSKDVPVYAVGVYKTGFAPVYNISVEKDHNYYANGALVSNCDCLRYIVATSPLPAINSATYGDQYQKNFGDKLYDNWIKSWYGKKEVKTASPKFGIKNEKNSWGV